jgi:hypothetical protein
VSNRHHERDRDAYERGRGYGGYGAPRDRSRSRHSGRRAGMSLTTILVIIACLYFWSKSQETGTTHTPKHPVSTVCNQYFKGGC